MEFSEYLLPVEIIETLRNIHITKEYAFPKDLSPLKAIMIWLKGVAAHQLSEKM